MAEAEVEEQRPPMPLVVWLLTGAIVLAYGAYILAPPDAQRWAEETFALIPQRFHADGPMPFTHWYEPLGAIFGHSFLHLAWWHAGLNAFFLFGASRLPALRLGWWRYLLIYFASVAGGALAFLAIKWNSGDLAIGASGGVCGMITAFFFSTRRTWREALADPQIRNPLGMLFFINVVAMGVLAETGLLPIAWEGHLGGFVGGGVAYALLQPKPRGPWG